MLTKLPPLSEMHRAFLTRDSQYDGVFFTAVITTGVFCRPTCSAKKPRRENVEFFPSVRDALGAGYRPCKRCQPLDQPGTPPAWVQSLLRQIDEQPSARWTDAELRAADFEPARVRRWFREHYGMTFHAFQRAHRVGRAVRDVGLGESISRVAFDSGYESLSGFRDAVTKIVGDAVGRVRDRPLVTVTRFTTPLGTVMGGASEDGVCLLEFTARDLLKGQLEGLQSTTDAVVVPGQNHHLELLAAELDAYFAGELQQFTISIAQHGTPFQERVWQALREVPYGSTRTYGQIAEEIGQPAARRAVGRANATNTVAIVVPCHRVVGQDGRLTGYAGGVWRKRYLLALEQSHL